MPKKQLTGKIISTKMPKTAVVEVESVKEHPKYKKRYKIHKKYKADVSAGEYQLGDIVLIEETRPISKDKKWKVVKKITSKTNEEFLEVPTESLEPSLENHDPAEDNAKSN